MKTKLMEEFPELEALVYTLWKQHKMSVTTSMTIILKLIEELEAINGSDAPPIPPKEFAGLIVMVNGLFTQGLTINQSVKFILETSEELKKERSDKDKDEDNDKTETTP